MSSDQSKLIRAARDLLERPDPMTAGIWPRASALLARQALESALDELWLTASQGPGALLRKGAIALPAGISR